MILCLVTVKLEEFKEGVYFGLAIGLVIIFYLMIRKYRKKH